jgi:signal transduction histidine kinase
LQFLPYLRLIVLTAGTLLPFFWIVIILGHRRQRNFERVFFFLCLALVFFFGGSLLALNAELYYATIPPSLAVFAWTIECLGLWMVPSLLFHLHIEYAQVRALFRSTYAKRVWLLGAYLPAALLLPRIFAVLRAKEEFNFAFPSNALGVAFQFWLLLSLILAWYWQRKFAQTAPDKEQEGFHRDLKGYFISLAAWVFAFHAPMAYFMLRHHLESSVPAGGGSATNGTLLLMFAISPLIYLIRNVQKFNFLQIGRQRNLMYAVFAAFLGLLYLSFIRRVSLWLDPYLPPEASAALLLFLPVAFFEPLQRFVGRLLHRTAQTEMNRAQRMMGPIQEVARLGNVEKLIAFVQKWVADELQLADAKLLLGADLGGEGSRKTDADVFAIRKGGQAMGVLRVKPYGAMLSGETEVALEYLSEQLPGALDLCRLIEEKLHLERELAERERLAVLGQMAASISHNLKNPLGSIKTILQVQLENTELPPSLRAETKMVLEEVNRLSATLSQLLKFSRPTVLGGNAASSDARAVLDEVLAVLRHEAERRGIDLHVHAPTEPFQVAASSEATHDILSNLLLNSLEATPRGGAVTITMRVANGFCEIVLEDDGTGIPADLQQKILQPFFTTKTQGTGLGLTIVSRRIAEAAGTLSFVSPRENGKGTRCTVALKVV